MRADLGELARCVCSVGSQIQNFVPCSPKYVRTASVQLTKSCYRQFMCKHKRIKVEKFSIEPSTELTLRFLLTPTRASRERPGEGSNVM